MITCMFKILSITNRRLCKEDFKIRIRKVALSGVDAVILREKDLSESEYLMYATEVLKICEECGITCILHTFYNVAKELGCRNIHMPLSLLERMDACDKDFFDMIGTSVHSVEEVKLADKLGARYVLAGHVFATDCKKGLEPRGLEFLSDVCDEADMPVFALGGIGPENAKLIRGTGAYGLAVMSGLMDCDNPTDYVNSLKAEE